MGGKKKKGGKGFFQQAAKVASGAVNGGVKVATAGTVDLENQKFSINPETMTNNFAGGITGQDIMDKANPVDPLAEIPEVVDPAIQQAQADAAIKAKVDDLYAPGKVGISSTVLGGSVATDGSTLKKKKLLGE